MGKLAPRLILLADANVLIDYLEADSEIIALTTGSIASVHVLRQVFDEAHALDESGAEELGITIVDPPTEDLVEAARVTSGPLSFEDRLCLLSCDRDGWICLTNDQALIRRCRAKGVQTKRGLRLMLDLVVAGQLGAERAADVADRIAEANPHHITTRVLAEFKRLLRNS